MPISWSIRCLYWDASIPESLVVNYSVWWTNTAQTISVSARDRGWSRLKRILLQQSTNGWGWTNVSDWDNLTAANNTTVSRNWVRTPVNGSTFRYRVLTYDYAGNSATYTNPWLIQFDTTPPSPADVTNNNPSNFLANNSQIYAISISNNGGSPIVQVDHQKENSINTSFSSLISDTASPWSYNWDISQVDNARLWNGSRQYTFRLRRICDEAGNCWSGTQDYNHNIYANTLFINETITQNQIVSGIADGVQRNFEFTLRDVYGNAIIPATGIWRTVDINVRWNNSLRLNQYDNNGNDSAIFVDNTSTTLPIGTTALHSLNTRSSTTWSYSVPFYVYAPTNVSDTLVPWFASISLDYDINRTVAIVTGDNPQTQSLLPATVLEYDSLYVTSITWDIESQWFIEWWEQISLITSTKAPSTANITSGTDDIRLEFGEFSSANNNINSRYDLSVNSTNIVEGRRTIWTELTNILNFGSNSITSLLTQSSTVNTLTQSYLASIVKYQINWRTIIYPSDIIGKDSYFWAIANNNTTQEGIKVLGLTSSDKTQELTTNQFSDDIRIVWKIIKSSFRKDILQKVFTLTKSLENTSVSIIPQVRDLWWNTWTTTLNNGQIVQEGTIQVYKWITWKYVEVRGDEVVWAKTLVVIGWDVYITGNITNSSGNDILGIIAIREAGQGWNIYIHPSVTDIHAVLYGERSLMSATDTSNNGVIDTAEIHNQNTPISTLANQLYIQWSLFSENTIWGSRSSPIECPYYVSCATSRDAQPYDLNFLRRYVRIDTDDDDVADTIANGGNSSIGAGATYPDYPIVIEYNSNLQNNPPPLFY